MLYNQNKDDTLKYHVAANGSMVTKGNQRFVYNELNLPSEQHLGDVSMYDTYDALGTKLRRHCVEAGNPALHYDTLRYYVDDIEYVGAGVKRIHLIQFEDGYIDSSLQNFCFFYKDHLNSVRSVVSKNMLTGAITNLGSTDYYPFGKPLYTLNGNNRYLYNGKELQDETGFYDYGARMYDPDIGRWMVVDLYSEKYFNYTSYNYVLNNPIKYIDPNGEYVDVSFIYKKNKDGSYVNPNIVKAFEIFAKSEVGREFLGQFAEKGQEVAGVKYSKSGEFDKNNIDLNFGTFSDPNAAAKTSTKEKNDGGLQITIGLEEKYNDDAVPEIIGELAHESFLHVEFDANDFKDDNKLNQSNIENDIKNFVNEHIKYLNKNGYNQQNGYSNPLNSKTTWEQHEKGRRSKILENKLFPVLKGIGITNPNILKDLIKYD